MEKFEGLAYEYMKFLGNSKIKSKTFEQGDGMSEQFEGRNAFNRYALFSYRGGDSINARGTLESTNDTEFVDSQQISSRGLNDEKNLESALEAALAQKTIKNNVENPRAETIINYFAENDVNAVEYDWTDFLYSKWYGRVPNNYMITLRRFPYAVEDNIFNKNITPNPDLARCITFWGEGTENSLNNVLGFSTGFNWKELQSEIQVMQSQKFSNPFGGLIGGITDGLSRAENVPAAQAKDASFIRTGQNFNDPVEVDGFYHNKVLGPVNVIDKMMIRDRGLNFTQEINLVCEYTLKSYPGISPKEAMLDILANLLTIGFNNAPFWGGAIRYTGDNRTSHLIGDQDKLLKGDYLGYLKSVGTSLESSFSNIFGSENGDFSFSSIIGGLMDMGKGFLSKIIKNKLVNSGAAPNYQVAKALLTGESTGEWHVTVGNPLNPIAVMGNLILEDMNIEFSEVLGSEDFPVGIKATFKLKPARPRDKTDIENMFNLGQGRLYFVPEKQSDILNLQGAEGFNYGVVNGAPGNNNNKDALKYNALGLKNQNNVYYIDRFKNHSVNGVMNSLKYHNVNEHIKAEVK